MRPDKDQVTHPSNNFLSNQKMATSLHDLLESSNFSEALNLINSEIKSFGAKAQLIQAKIFCLINMEKFTLALSTIKMAHKNGLPQIAFAFESAYCLYRLGKFLSALNLIEKSKIDSRLKVLKGQILYRLERFDEAAEIFNNLIKTGEFSVEDLQVNLLAAKAQARMNSNEKVESYDATYNLALVKLANDDFKAAEQLVNECEKILENENVSQNDSINLKLISTCAMMGEKENWPEAEFLLRKLKTINGLTPVQHTLITANLMAIADKNKNNDYSNGFNVNNVEMLSLFKSQKHQILANAHSYGIKLSDSQKKLIKSDSSTQMEDDQTHFIEILKKNFSSTKKSTKTKGTKTSAKVTKPLDKERWMPLRDRSYYKPKAKYLKSVSVKKTSSSK